MPKIRVVTDGDETVVRILEDDNHKKRRYEQQQITKGRCRTGCGRVRNKYAHRCDVCQQKEHRRWREKYGKRSRAQQNPSRKQSRASVIRRKQGSFMNELLWAQKQNRPIEEVIQRWKKQRRVLHPR